MMPHHITAMSDNAFFFGCACGALIVGVDKWAVHAEQNLKGSR